LTPRGLVTVTALREDGSKTIFEVILRLDTPIEMNYYLNGGILQAVLRNMLAQS
jgi:aconitate hydratase